MDDRLSESVGKTVIVNYDGGVPVEGKLSIGATGFVIDDGEWNHAIFWPKVLQVAVKKGSRLEIIYRPDQGIYGKAQTWCEVAESADENDEKPLR